MQDSISDNVQHLVI